MACRLLPGVGVQNPDVGESPKDTRREPWGPHARACSGWALARLISGTRSVPEPALAAKKKAGQITP
jgi:hypothetical protein